MLIPMNRFPLALALVLSLGLAIPAGALGGCDGGRDASPIAPDAAPHGDVGRRDLPTDQGYRDERDQDERDQDNGDPNGDQDGRLDPDQGPAPAPPPETLDADRPAAVFYPADYDPTQAWPLVILLHGYGVSGAIQDLYLGFHEAATAAGYIALVPEGTKGPEGSQCWNADIDWCCDLDQVTVDDQAYLMGLMGEAATRINADPTRVFFVGHSNGAFMAQKMACDHADAVAGIVSIAGSLPVEAAGCAPSAPVSVALVHGTDDDTVLYDGSEGLYPSAQETALRWRALDGCPPTADSTVTKDYATDLPGPETTAVTWTPCQRHTAVAVFTVEGAGHIPVFSPAFMTDAMLFFQAHPRSP